MTIGPQPQWDTDTLPTVDTTTDGTVFDTAGTIEINSGTSIGQLAFGTTGGVYTFSTSSNSALTIGDSNTDGDASDTSFFGSNGTIANQVFFNTNVNLGGASTRTQPPTPMEAILN